MDTILPGIFALLVGVAGWYYMFYSTAANRMAAVERADVNRWRILLRRLGGLMMILLAITFYVGTMSLQQGHSAVALGCLAAVVLLLAIVVALGLIDLRMTHRLRQGPEKRD
jgi:uncharacterized membrane protein